MLFLFFLLVTNNALSKKTPLAHALSDIVYIIRNGNGEGWGQDGYASYYSHPLVTLLPLSFSSTSGGKIL